MKQINSPLDECSRCHSNEGIWDVGLCMDCMWIESGERLQARLKDGSIEKAITKLQGFLYAIRHMKVIPEKTQQDYRELVKQINTL